MKNPIRSKFIPAALLGAGLLLSAASALAQSFHVVIDTTALTVAPASAFAPFSLDFQLNSGATLNNNTAVISNFTFGGGGAPFGAVTAIGGATGDLGTSSVTLTDTAAFNEFFQAFTVGGTLAFDFSLSQNLDAGATPDGFTIAILDSELFNITTGGFANQLLSADILGGAPGIQTFAGTGDYAGVTLTVTAIPEPSTYAAILGALVLAGIIVHRRRHAATAAAA